MVEVIFHGAAGLKDELFGVRIPIPRTIGDEQWQAMVGPNPEDPASSAGPEDWASLMSISEVLESYDMMDPTNPPAPDAQGVRWLYQIH